MPKERSDIIQDNNYWKMAISDKENIPLNPNHTYKDENDIYERLTEYVKDWVESIFGVYTKEDGSLEALPEYEESSECKDWVQTIGGRLTPMTADWYQIALKGTKKGATLPQITGDESARDDIQNAVRDTFFPAYRALKDSFSKRWWFEYFFNHKQYVAERDALKVVTNLITSMTGYTKKELDTEYVQYRQNFQDEEIAKATIASREVDIYEPEETEELFKDEKKVARYIKVEKRGKIERVEEVQDELFADERRLDERFITDESMGEILDIDYDEPIEDNLPAEEKIEKYNNNEDIDEMCVKFMNELKTTPENEDAIWRALHINMYEPLHGAAKFFCTMYDTYKNANKGEKLKTEFAKLAKRSAKHLFETAFKALGEEDSREIVTTVKGKEVREKVGGSLFGINTLKDRIVAAQKLANVMLSYRTPVGFYKELSSGEFEMSYHVMENADVITDYIKANYGGKYGENEINTAMKLAKNEFEVKYRGEKPITYGCFEIGYRPDPSQIFVEQKMLGNAQKMIKNGVIKDDVMKAIVNANVAKWKAVSDMHKHGSTLKMKDVEKKWIESDKKLAEAYKDYDAVATETAVEDALVEYNKQKKEKIEALKVDLNEPKANVVPPVEEKPVEINAPSIEK